MSTPQPPAHSDAATSPGLSFSVVICAHNEERYGDLLDAVASVQRQSVLAQEIVVVLDHNPRLLELLRRADLPGVVVVDSREPRGLGGARNSGIRMSRGAIVAFLDDDAVAVPEWLERLQAGYRDPETVGVGGAIEPLWLGAEPRWLPAEFHWVVGCSYRGMPQAAAAVRNLLGCNMSFRREVLEAVGGFRLGYGCDETDLCIRVRQRWPHKTLLYLPEARVHHKVPTSRARWSYFRSRCYFEGGSKAVVSRLVGPGDGLASERAYTVRTLPRGIVRNVADAALRADLGGLQRAAYIVAGLLVTAAGYLNGTIFVAEAARARGWSALVIPDAATDD